MIANRLIKTQFQAFNAILLLFVLVKFCFFLYCKVRMLVSYWSSFSERVAPVKLSGPLLLATVPDPPSFAFVFKFVSYDQSSLQSSSGYLNPICSK